MLVVFYHIMIVQEKIGTGDHLLPGWFLIGISGVDLFFTISGFVMVVVTRGKFQQVTEMGRFLRNRLTRIYPMYWLFTLAAIVAFTVVGSRAMVEDNLFRSLLLIPQEKAPLLSVGWTLIHEVYFYMVFTLLLCAPEKCLAGIMAGWAILILTVHLALAATGTVMSSPVSQVAVHPLTLEFIMGALVALFTFRRGARGGIFLLSSGVVLWIAGGTLFYVFRIDALIGDWARVVCLGLPSAVLLAGAVILEKETGASFPRVLQIVGDASYSIYLSHFLVIFAIGRIYVDMVASEGINELVLAGGMFGGVVIVGMGSYRILERPLIRLFRN